MNNLTIIADETTGGIDPGRSIVNPEAGLNGDTGLQSDVTNIINVIIGLLGIVAVVVIIIGGVQYMTASGDASKVKKAKDTILYGIIGLIVVILAAAIVNFVIARVANTGTAA